MKLVAEFIRFWRGAFRRRIMLGVVLIQMTLTVAFVADMAWRQYAMLRQNALSAAFSLGHTLALNSANWVLSNDVAGLTEVVQGQTHYPGLAYAMVVLPDGKVLAHSDIRQIGVYLTDPASGAMLRSGAHVEILIDDGELVDVAVPVMSRGRRLAWARVALDQSAVRDATAAIVREGVLYALLALVAGACLAFYLVRGLNRGLIRFGETAQRVSAGEHDLRADAQREDELGELAGHFNTMLDALQRSETNRLLALRAARMGEFDIDFVQGNITLSAEICRLIGLVEHGVTMTREAYRAMMPPEDREAMRHAVDEAMLRRQPFRIEYRLQLAGSEIRHVAAVGVPFGGEEEGRPRRCIGILQDISDRKRAEAELVQSNRLYRVLSRVNAAAIRCEARDELFHEACRILVEDGGIRMAWIGWIEGGDESGRRGMIVPVASWGHIEHYLDDFRIDLADANMTAGVTGRAVLDGRHVLENDIQDIPHVFPWWKGAVTRGYHGAAAFPLRMGRRTVGNVTVYSGERNFFTPEILKVFDELAAEISLALDFIEANRLRGEAEEELHRANLDLEQRVERRTRELGEANRELEAFSYSVSHDLRAPLRSIDGFSQILIRKYRDVLDDTGRDYLDRVVRAAQRMGELIDDMLLLSRVSRGEVQRVPVDVSRLARTILHDLASAHPQRQVEHRVEDHVEILADAGLMRIALENLLGNAWKFTRNTEGACIEVGRMAGGKGFYVRDNGAGFDMKYAGKLFSPFQRLHAEKDFEGTGIGLATVQRIVARHGGGIRAEAEPGRGACFYVELD